METRHQTGDFFDIDTKGPVRITEPQAFCAHRAGIERVEVTQPRGEKYEFWRCIECKTEFRPTGEQRY